MKQEWFHIFVTVICLFHGIWWSKSNYLNLLVKVVFYIAAVWGILVVLRDFGMVIKI